MKRFIQGLGVGILLSTLVFTIAYTVVGGKELTDAQIKAKAKQLGMVEKEESIFSTPVPTEPANDETKSEGTADGVTGSAVEQGNSQQPVVTENAEQPPVADEQAAVSENPTGTVSFTVQSGEGATKISENLQAAGLVDDAVAFDRYLRSQKYTTVILVGTYDLRPGMSYEELAAVLLGR